MKRIFSILVALAAVLGLSANTIYLVPNDWRSDGAVFFVHSWGSGDHDTKMTEENSNLYSAVIPDGDNMVIFVRMPSGSASMDWNKKWNQTGNLTLGTKNCYTITGWGDNDGSWSQYTPPTPDPEAPNFYITGDSALVVDAGFPANKKWNADAIPSEKDTFVLNLKAGVEYKLKLTKDGTWDTVKGYSNLTETKEGLTQDSDGNICFRLTAAGAVKVIYTGTVFKVLGDFVVPCAESYGLMIDGVYHPGTRNNLQTEWIEYVLRNVVLTKGQRIKVHSVCADATWVITKYAETSYELPIVDGAYVVGEDGTYDFYIKFIFEADEMYIAKHGTYTTAVRSQCTDVLMQAFFNESYNNSAPGVGDDDYHLNLGNTKWETLLPQAEEIGHYFDLVWLPPSANGSGMGYHPKQYSNQNSMWGSDTQLAALISALHDAGSKVVADIVINHCEGWTSWCDFPELDFGEYGKFYPDASYICQNDEVNAEWNKESAGACWGTATGNYDDGENWDGARDWAHDAVKVQNMFKAYLKWMRNVVGYDGFRYDKGDGFNNWHHDNYNKAAGPYIAFMECYSNTDVIKSRIEGANYNLMALDFDTKWHVFDSFAGWNFARGRGEGLLGQNWGKYAVTFIDSHDWFLRPDNENEFGGRGNSLKEALKPRLLMANAFLLSMPGVPCVFYPHWAKYKGFLKNMINARKLAGIHSESEVKDEYFDENGYQATIVGKDGFLILCLGNKAHQNFEGFNLMSSYYAENDCSSGKDGSHQIWVQRTTPLPTGMENGQSDKVQSTKGEKFMKDGKLYIRWGEKVYDAMGRLVK